MAGSLFKRERFVGGEEICWYLLRKNHGSTQPRTYEKIYREAGTKWSELPEKKHATHKIMIGTPKQAIPHKTKCASPPHEQKILSQGNMQQHVNISFFCPPMQVMLGGGHINADMQQFLENDKKANAGLGRRKIDAGQIERNQEQIISTHKLPS